MPRSHHLLNSISDPLPKIVRLIGRSAGAITQRHTSEPADSGFSLFGSRQRPPLLAPPAPSSSSRTNPQNRPPLIEYSRPPPQVTTGISPVLTRHCYISIHDCRYSHPDCSPYRLEIVQHPLRAAEFGTSTLTRLAVAPPLIAQAFYREQTSPEDFEYVLLFAVPGVDLTINAVKRIFPSSSHT